jgi:hypothetical protein
MESPKEAWPCNTCEGYSKYVNRNIYINQPDTIAIRRWDAEDAFNEQKTWKKATVEDNINAPKHYMLFEAEDLRKEEGIEVRDVIAKLVDKMPAMYVTQAPLFISDYVQMMQYLMRFMDKNGLEDLKKGSWYLNKLIDTYGKPDA